MRHKNKCSGQSLLSFMIGLPTFLVLALTGFLVIIIPFAENVQKAAAFREARRILYAQSQTDSCPEKPEWNFSDWFQLSMTCSPLNQVSASSMLFSTWETHSAEVYIPLPPGEDK